MASRADLRTSLNSGETVRCAVEASPSPGDPPDAESPEELVICPLVAKDGLRGLIAVCSIKALSEEVTNTIETLAAQAQLALDRETLTETFHARQSEARFQTLVQNASDVILIRAPRRDHHVSNPLCHKNPWL